MGSSSIPATVQLDGIRLVNLAMDEAVAAIACALSSRQPTRIAFVNADCANLAVSNGAYRDDLSSCDWVFIDGIGMRIAGQVMGQPVRDNVNGTDLFPRLCEMLSQQERSIYLLGARHGVAAAAAGWAAQRYPGLKIAGTQHGYFAAEEIGAVLADIRRSRADVLLVAFGAPQQEAWMRRHFADTGSTVAIGVGGLFDYYADRIPRAPLWMRRLGLEWIFRLIQEPGRLWRRYLVGNLIFLGRLARNRLTRRPHEKPFGQANRDTGSLT